MQVIKTNTKYITKTKISKIYKQRRKLVLFFFLKEMKKTPKLK